METVVRRADMNDIESIVDMYVVFAETLLIPDPYYNREVDRDRAYRIIENTLEDNERRAFFVAEKEGQTIGYVDIWLLDKDFHFFADDYAYINAIFVKEIYRNLSNTIKLYRRAEEWAMNNNYKYLVADVLYHNDRVARALKKDGFNRYRTRVVKNLI